jgi:putative membrane protein
LKIAGFAIFPMAQGTLERHPANKNNMLMKNTIKLIYGVSAALLFAGPAWADSTELSAQDKEFAENALSSGKSNVQLGDMASQKGTGTEVKELGSIVAKSDGKSDAELKQMLDEKGISTTMTSAKSAVTSAGQSLEGVTSANVDKDCVQGIVKNAEKNVAECKKEVAEGTDTELKAYAAKELPIQEEHLKLAEHVESTLQ